MWRSQFNSLTMKIKNRMRKLTVLRNVMIMTMTLFEQWFSTCFLPLVIKIKERRIKMRINREGGIWGGIFENFQRAVLKQFNPNLNKRSPLFRDCYATVRRAANFSTPPKAAMFAIPIVENWFTLQAGGGLGGQSVLLTIFQAYGVWE